MKIYEMWRMPHLFERAVCINKYIIAKCIITHEDKLSFNRIHTSVDIAWRSKLYTGISNKYF